jgi:hypothetical protein
MMQRASVTFRQCSVQRTCKWNQSVGVVDRASSIFVICLTIVYMIVDNICLTWDGPSAFLLGKRQGKTKSKPVA